MLLADDHAIVRRGLRSLVEEAGLSVVAEAADGLEAIRLTEEHRPDLIIVDVGMPRLNGIEVAGGSIRIHQKDVQALNFKALGMTPEKARERFGFFLEALDYGTPPHGGFAAGIERTLMALLGNDNIRDLIAFPKTASAQDLMMDSPGEVDKSQLEELGIKTSTSAQ